MGKFDGILNVFKMNNEGEDDYDEYDGYDDEEYEAPKQTRKVESTADEYEEKKPRNLLQPKNPLKPIAKKGNMNNMEVCVIKPTVFDDCLEVADALLAGRSVVLNLEGVAAEPSQRIVDFVSGACYSLKAHFESISKAVYVITPESVYISGVTQENGLPTGKQF